MKRQSFIRILGSMAIVLSAVFVVVAAGKSRAVTSSEECTQAQNEDECPEKNVQSEFLLESLTRSLLGR